MAVNTPIDLYFSEKYVESSIKIKRKLTPDQKALRSVPFLKSQNNASPMNSFIFEFKNIEILSLEAPSPL